MTIPVTIKHEISRPVKSVWFIGYNTDMSFFHKGENRPNQVTKTNLDVLERFNKEDDYIARAEVLGIDLEEFTPLLYQEFDSEPEFDPFLDIVV